MKTVKEIIIETLQGEGLMYAYRDFADDIKDEHIEKIADKIVKNLNIPDVIKCDGDERKALLVAFVNDWYKDNPFVSEDKKEAMVNKFLSNQ